MGRIGEQHAFQPKNYESQNGVTGLVIEKNAAMVSR